MPEPVEFSSFYKLLRDARDGNALKTKELEWMLAEYEHAKEAKSAYDELGQIFCHHGVMELYDYVGVDDICYIKTIEENVWDYLQIRMKVSPADYMIKSMLNHAKAHKLSKRVSEKWSTELLELEENLEDLAKYVTEGILEIIN